MFLRQTTGAIGDIGHDVDRVAGDDQDAAEAGHSDLCGHIFCDTGIDADQLQTGLSRFLCGTGSDDDDIRISAFFVIAGLDRHLGICVWQTITEVHLFADRLVLVHVDEYQLIDPLF